MSSDTDVACNHFELRIKGSVARARGKTTGPIRLCSEVWVDGQHLDEPHWIDLPLLVQSLYESRRFDIFTCGCGVGSCAGIVDGIEVRHEVERVLWSFRRPLAVESLSDPAWDEWERTAVPCSLTFHRAQMLMAINTYLDQVRTLVGSDEVRFEWPVHGLSVQDVLKIDPTKPFYDIDGRD